MILWYPQPPFPSTPIQWCAGDAVCVNSEKEKPTLLMGELFLVFLKTESYIKLSIHSIHFSRLLQKDNYSNVH